MVCTPPKNDSRVTMLLKKEDGEVGRERIIRLGSALIDFVCDGTVV